MISNSYNKIARVLSILENSNEFKDRIEFIKILPEKSPKYGNLKKDLPLPLQNYLKLKGIKLYIHQCETIDEIRAGNNIVITTPTASGKTLAFNLPIIEHLLENQDARALYIYPTKALSNDQLKVLKDIEKISGINLNPSIYDGDTPREIRPHIRDYARIIITNPYELHHTLSWHHKWQLFLSNLKFIVLDEAHSYRGVFGSNIAFLIRRLRRICERYNSFPQFIVSTATLANPIEFAEKLTGLKFKHVNNDGSPKSKKYFILYNPYFGGKGELTTYKEAQKLMLLFIKNNIQTLCFTTSRKWAEIITNWIKLKLKNENSPLYDQVMSYKAGFLPNVRREIENGLKSGKLKGVVSTNALELGIDIGSLDSVLISGYPGTMLSTWQQAGRAGRGKNDSIVIFIAFQNPLDQYFMKHPDVFFGKPHEHAIIDLNNPYILSGQILCAAAELPIRIEKDKKFFGNNLKEILYALESHGLIRKTPHGWIFTDVHSIKDTVKLNNISSEVFKIKFRNKVIETMDLNQAYREAHEGAVLIHKGETYIVTSMDLKNKIVNVIKESVDYYTMPLKNINVSIINKLKSITYGNLTLNFGELKVTETYHAYKIIKNNTVIGYEPLNLPSIEFNTKGIWFELENNLQDKIWDKRKLYSDINNQFNFNPDKEESLKIYTFHGGLHGIEHAIIAIMPFHVMCDRWDIGGVSIPSYIDTGKPTIFIYDAFEGGIGLSEKAMDLFPEILKMTFELVKDCKCKNGCPGCIFSPKCGNDNKPLDKISTLLILDHILNKINL